MALLQAGPDPHFYPDQRWTCPRVQEVIGVKFDVWYHVDHLSRLLHAWGFSRQKPTKRAAEQDQEAVMSWIQMWGLSSKRRWKTEKRLLF